MLLRNQDLYDEFLEVDIVGGVRRRFRIRDDEEEPTNGMFFEHDGSLFGLGTNQGSLFVLLEGRLLRYDAGIETQLEESGETRAFAAYHNSELLYSATYTAIKASGWIPNEDDECLDGLLWIHNVLANPDRQECFLKQNTDGYR